MPFKLVVPLLALVLLCGCAQETIVATAEPMCGAITQICISRDDRLTEGTATQIEGNNLARRRLCPANGDPCASVRVKVKPAPAQSRPALEPKLSNNDADPFSGVVIPQIPQVDTGRAKRVAGL